jgi:hypothetical protein
MRPAAFRTFRMKNVQKFHPGIDCWLSDRLTSSSLWDTAVSNAKSSPSLTLESSSAQAAGLSLATGHASCTHLQIIEITTLQQPICEYAPVFFVRVEVRPYLVEHVAFYLEEIRRRITGIRTDDVYDDPFLVLSMTQGGLPVLNLLFDGSLICIAILLDTF